MPVRPLTLPSVERQNVYQILDNVTKIHRQPLDQVRRRSFRAIRTAFAQSHISRAADTTSTANTPQNSTLVELKHL